jgi:hypothetical protein
VKDSFNADFYSVIATVIPVLYLAIAVQGSTFSTLLNWLRALVIRTQGRIVALTERRVKLRRKLGNKGLRGILVFINVLGYSVVLAVALSLVLSLLAEVFAILALYHRQENPYPALFIIPVIALAAVIALVPLGSLTVTFARLRSIARRDRKDRKKAYQISEGTRAGLPLTRADYRFVLSRQRTREDAERFVEEWIARELLFAQSSPGKTRPGSATTEDMLKALAETFPVSDTGRVREIAEKFARIHAKEIAATALEAEKNRIAEELIKYPQSKEPP